jgi:hypothetical protein
MGSGIVVEHGAECLMLYKRLLPSLASFLSHRLFHFFKNPVSSFKKKRKFPN